MPSYERDPSKKPLPKDFPDWDDVYAPSNYATINKTLRRIADLGGCELGFKHRDRPTTFNVQTSDGKTVPLTEELCTCSERATFSLPLRMAKKEEEPEVVGCVVCDAANLWPRLGLA